MKAGFLRLEWFLATIIAVVFLNLPSSADARNRVVDRGACVGGTVLKLAVKRENPGFLEVEFEIDEARPGDLWRLVLKQNGRTIYRETLRVGASEEIEVELFTENTRGRDRIATASSGGQRCVLRANSRFGN